MFLYLFYMFAHYAQLFRRCYTAERAVLSLSPDYSSCAFPLLTTYRRPFNLKYLGPRQSRVFLLAVDVFSSLSDVLRGCYSPLEASYSPLVRGRPRASSLSHPSQIGRLPIKSVSESFPSDGGFDFGYSQSAKLPRPGYAASERPMGWLLSGDSPSAKASITSHRASR